MEQKDINNVDADGDGKDEMVTDGYDEHDQNNDDKQQQQLTIKGFSQQKTATIIINDKNIVDIEREKQPYYQQEVQNHQNQKEEHSSNVVVHQEEQLTCPHVDNNNSQGPSIITNVIQKQQSQLQQQQQQYKKSQQQSIIINESQHKQTTKPINNQPQLVTTFHPQYKSTTISLTNNQSHNQIQQSKYYYQNYKLALTQQITSNISSITFRIDNLKYCIGMGVGLKQVVQKHQYDYKSTTSNELGHGLYLITTQGYSWSHSQTQQDDVFRGDQWKNLYTGANIQVKLQGEQLTFRFKKILFKMTIPSLIRDKYTLCFCVYLHQKTDAVSIVGPK